MISKPLIIFDPIPRNEDMVYTTDVKKELNEISNLVTHFGSRAPDYLIEKNLYYHCCNISTDHYYSHVNFYKSFLFFFSS